MARHQGSPEFRTRIYSGAHGIANGLLRTLGASRRRVLAALVVEFVSLGVLAGLLASLIASGVAYLLATRVFELEFAFDPIVVGAGLVGGGVIVGLSGVLATYSVVRQPPAGVLAQASWPAVNTPRTKIVISTAKRLDCEPRELPR